MAIIRLIQSQPRIYKLDGQDKLQGEPGTARRHGTPAQPRRKCWCRWERAGQVDC